MKKFLFSMLMLALVAPVCAQNYNFPINEAGECVFSGTVSNSNSKSDNYNKAKAWCNNQGFTAMNIISDTPSEAYTMNIGYIITQKYNPFAGAFVENLIFDMHVEVADNQVTYSFRNMQIQEVYGGWGTSNKINTIKAKMDLIVDAKKKIEEANNNESLSKKERKKIVGDAEGDIKNAEETLEKAYKEFNEKLDNFVKALQ